MDTNSVMQEMTRSAGLTMKQASLDMGRSANWLSSTLSRPGGSEAATVASLAEVCGYALAAVPVDDLPPSALVIDPRR